MEPEVLLLAQNALLLVLIMSCVNPVHAPPPHAVSLRCILISTHLRVVPESGLVSHYATCSAYLIIHDLLALIVFAE